MVFGGVHDDIALNSLLLVYSFAQMPSVARLYFELSICPLSGFVIGKAAGLPILQALTLQGLCNLCKGNLYLTQRSGLLFGLVSFSSRAYVST